MVIATRARSIASDDVAAWARPSPFQPDCVADAPALETPRVGLLTLTSIASRVASLS
jgi:hypothetical protein